MSNAHDISVIFAKFIDDNPEVPVKGTLDGIYFCPGYADPRIDHSAGINGGEWGGILFADWNEYPNDLLDAFTEAGYECKWSDEWDTCSDCGLAVRTSADSYFWQPGYVVHQCDIVCIACLLKNGTEDYLESLEDDPTKALNVSEIDPAKYNYVKLEDQFESGFHPGQTDNPRTIFAKYHDQHERLLFKVDEVSQFYIVFSVWRRTISRDEALTLLESTLTYLQRRLNEAPALSPEEDDYFEAALLVEKKVYDLAAVRALSLEEQADENAATERYMAATEVFDDVPENAWAAGENLLPTSSATRSKRSWSLSKTSTIA